MEPQTPSQNNTIKESEHSNQDDRLKSTSVSSASSPKSPSSDSSVEDPYNLDVDEHGSFALEDDHSNSDTKLETPPAQVMERPADTSDYRIPSHVFASNKSSSPNPDWSTASNESLFSIHTGNMSFTRDQFNGMLKSGELGLYPPGDIPGDIPKSPRIILKSGEQKPVEQQISSMPLDKASTAPAAPPSERSDVEVKSPPKINEAAGNKKDDSKQEVKILKGRSSVSDEVSPSNNVSPHSEASCQSFAFPVFAEIDRDKSINSGQSRAKHSNNITNTEEEQPKTPTSAASAARTSSSWFSCFARCSCC